MSKETELLERAHQFIWNKDGYDNELAEEIRAFLKTVVAESASTKPVVGSTMEHTTKPVALFTIYVIMY